MEKLNKKKNYRFWHSPLVLFIFFVILVFFSYQMIDLIKKQRETVRKKNLIMNEVYSLEARKDAISEKIMKLEKETGEEEIIREKYQLVQEGEKMIIIVDEVPYEDSQVKEQLSFFDRLKDFFKNKK
jgi:cell division protein FtsB